MLKEALLYDKLDNYRLRCKLCAHRCLIDEGSVGFCGVRENKKGILYSLVYGRLIAVNVDPIEKKPLYHFLPGSGSFSLATAGCNFRCGFCQNWQISQISDRQAAASPGFVSSQDIVSRALDQACRSISYTYTEPTIFFEYAYETARIAKNNGLYNVFVTNGYMSQEALEMITPYLDAANIDLKSFRDDFYRQNCQARLAPVCETIKRAKEAGVWIEVTTLIIPGENDSRQELEDIAGFIAGISVDIPWHISRFHPDYSFSGYQATPPEALERALACGKKAGLRYTYLGNTPRGNDTFCCRCSKRIVSRSYFNISENNIDKGKCSFCGTPVAGVFA
jgi:pyruvate formate lyase activating enzyme